MTELTAERIADALLYGGRLASVENFMLSDDPDVPIYPEALVQVEVAKALKQKLRFSSVKLEADTDALAMVASGYGPDHQEFPEISRRGNIDIVCWQHVLPQVFVEVKDQISGTDDGITADMVRLQEFLQISHRLEAKGPHVRMPRYGALLYYVGKHSPQYKHGKHLASQFSTYAKMSVDTSLANLRKVIDHSAFDLLIKQSRVMDSAKDGQPDPALANTVDEETVSGSEQYTVCIACVISLKSPLNMP